MDAIQDMPYTTVCKARPSPPSQKTLAYSSQVALQFSTRFWEHYANPIVGGCSTSTDIPGIGSICYPSYNLNATGPGVMLASYTNADFGIRFASMPELEHVQYVLNAMIEIHGEVAREQYTGKYNRHCWALDPLESASWASPSVGMHTLYIPAFFRTENNVGHFLGRELDRCADFDTDDFYWRTYQVSTRVLQDIVLPADYILATPMHGVRYDVEQRLSRTKER